MFYGFGDMPTTPPLATVVPATSKGHRKLRERRKARRAMRKASRRR